MLRLGLCAVTFCVLSVSSGSLSAEPPDEPRATFWVIPHTHWEGAVFKTREEYLQMGLANILKALHLLKTQPEYRFVLDQVAYVKPFLERYPEEEAAFRKFIVEGRLQLVLGMDIMPDVNMPGGESFIRQILYGKGYYRRKLGVDVTAGWLIDTFGHHAQMPQLLKQAGYQSFWFSRGVPRPNHPSEFLWEGIDGTRIPAFWLPYSYGLMYGSPKDSGGFADFVRRRFGLLTPNSATNDRVGLSGADVSEPEEHLVPRVREFNQNADRPFTLRMAVPADYEAVVAKRKDLPVLKGELNPIFQGTYSSRIELKQWMRRMERLLTTAEKTGVLAGWLGSPIDNTMLWRAWEPVLFNETHDLASGVMTDHVYEDTTRSFEFSRRLADELIQSNWARLAAQIDTRGEGIPVAVFNTLGWPRTDLAEVSVAITNEAMKGITLLDAAGRDVPIQALEIKRYADGGLKEVRIAFTAVNVPALGYSVYHVVPKLAGNIQLRTPSPGASLDNEFYRLTFDSRTGALTSLHTEANQWEALTGPANIVARTPDHGDLWELYRGLDGGSKIAMTQRQPVPRSGQATLSSDDHGEPGTVVAGPVYSEFKISHPFGSGSYATTVRLLAEMRRIDFRTTILNQVKFVRYQALFPTTIRSGKNFQSIPFGVIERPSGIEFPAQDWVDYSDGRHGFALLNRGLPGNVVTDGTMMLSLLRSHTLGAYGFGGGYEPGMSSDTGLQLGKALTLHYAVVPHEGDWRQARVYQDGLEFANPLLCQKVSAHAGPLPKRWGFVEVSQPNVLVSALKPGNNGEIILRVYEASGEAVTGVKIKLSASLVSARECNLMEDRGGEVRRENSTIKFDLRPFQIKTFAIHVNSARAVSSK
jgi:alpha-mannosidase